MVGGGIFATPTNRPTSAPWIGWACAQARVTVEGGTTRGTDGQVEGAAFLHLTSVLNFPRRETPPLKSPPQPHTHASNRQHRTHAHVA
jgi:hypothetical protein